jgi:hypothetical protein
LVTCRETSIWLTTLRRQQKQWPNPCLPGNWLAKEMQGTWLAKWILNCILHSTTMRTVNYRMDEAPQEGMRTASLEWINSWQLQQAQTDREKGQHILDVAHQEEMQGGSTEKGGVSKNLGREKTGAGKLRWEWVDLLRRSLDLNK